MPKKLAPTTWIIVPSLNEAKDLPTVLKAIKKYTKNFIVIDDGSSDQSAAVARRYTPYVFRHEINLGKGAALMTGCQYAFNDKKAQAVIFIDSDNQHNPDHLASFQKELGDGHDIVFGVRDFTKDMPLIKIMANRFSSWMIYVLFGSYIPDIPSGYKALSRKGFQKIAWSSSDYAVELEIAARVAKYKLNFATIPIDTIYLDYERGMTVLHVIKMISKVISWRVSL